MAEPLLHVDNLGKRFGGFVALDGINLSVQPGERVGLIGPNGSGKSTLVNCMCGTLHNETGTVPINVTRVEPRFYGVTPSSLTLALAVISAIAFTTVLGTVSGLIMAAAGAVAHDIMSNLLKMKLDDGQKVLAGEIESEHDLSELALGIGARAAIAAGQHDIIEVDRVLSKR